MSLINKMLQDLDARGSQGAGFTDMDVKPVVLAEPRVATPMIAAAVVGAIVLGLIGWFAWRYFKAAPDVPPQIVVLGAPAAPAAPAMTVAVPVASPIAQRAGPAAVPAPMASPPLTLKPVAVAPATVVRPSRREVEAATPRLRVVQAAQPAPLAPQAVPVRQPGASRSAQAAYSAALDRLQQGRVDDAMAGLEQALQIDPRHEAARQTLVGLLIEDNKPDQAMAQLQAGLALDPRQPSLAMLLARMQIERGGSGIDTLTRSLPAASGNGEYLALLAGALQREQRHAEAAAQYLAALRIAPQNGVWLMGLGISLQGAKRDADAAEAFERAKATGTLSPQLLSFVERQLQQLAK